MKRVGTWLCLFTKRYCKKPVYLLILLLLPLCSVLLSKAEQKSGTKLCAAFVMPEEEFLTKLSLEQTDSAVQFIRYDSEEEVEEAVLRKDADCGYVFSEHFSDRLWEEEGRNSIRLYTGQDDSTAFLANEILLNKIFQVYSEESYVNYVGAKIGKEYTKEAKELLQKRLRDGSTFSFTYIGELPEENSVVGMEENRITGNVMPLRGMLAFWILLYGMCGVLDAVKMKEAGSFIWARCKYGAEYLCVVLPMAAGAAMSLLCLFISGNWEGIGKEAGVMLLYVILTALFCSLFGKICGTEHRIAVSVPFFMIACILFTPIFWNIKAIVPIVGMIEKIFPVTWYLSIF